MRLLCQNIGTRANQTRGRCSGKGILSLSTMDYLELLDASSRMVRPDAQFRDFGTVALPKWSVPTELPSGGRRFLDDTETIPVHLHYEVCKTGSRN